MRETVGVNHRYVRTLLNALVLQVGASAKAEKVLEGAWAPGMKSEDQARMVAELEKLQNHPILRPKTENPLKEDSQLVASDPIEQALTKPPHTSGDVNDDILGELLGQPQKPTHPLLEEMKKYGEAAATFLEQKGYLKSPMEHHKVISVGGEQFVLMYTAVLRKAGGVTIHLNGTSGSARKLLDLDATYLAEPNGRRCLIHEGVIPGYQSVVFTVVAARLVPGRSYRFWVSRRLDGDGQDFLKIRSTMDDQGCPIDNSSVTLVSSKDEFFKIFN